MTRFMHYVSMLATILAVLVSLPVLAAPDDLDETFLDGGLVSLPMPETSYGVIRSVLLQPDGKIITVGHCGGEGRDFCVMRQKPDGYLDPDFGGGTGIVFTSILKSGSYSDRAFKAALYPGGRIVVVGQCGDSTSGEPTKFCLARYAGNGELDTTLNGTGTLVLDMGSNVSEPRGIAVLPDGQIVVGGYCAPTTENAGSKFCMARLGGDGSLDTGFGIGGIAEMPMDDAFSARAYAMTLLPDGKILIGGWCFSYVCVARFTSDGQLDAETFNSEGGTRGVAGINVAGGHNVYSILVQPDGGIVAAGLCQGADLFQDFCLWRMRSDGTVDPSFGDAGLVRYGINHGGSETPANEIINAIGLGGALQPDGKIIVAGYCRLPGSKAISCVARYNSDGSPDITFGDTGRVLTDIGGGDYHTHTADVVMQPDGKILTVGRCFTGDEWTSTDWKACMARYEGYSYEFKGCSFNAQTSSAVPIFCNSFED